MEPYIPISFLNDFIFCPRSIYFHQLYGRSSESLYHSTDQSDDFDFINGQYRLFGDKAKPYTKWLLEAILEYKNEMFLYVQQYYRAFMQEKTIGAYPMFLGKTP